MEIGTVWMKKGQAKMANETEKLDKMKNGFSSGPTYK